MRVERIRVDAFGRLHGLDTGPEPLGQLVVVCGPNEAGKTTLFHFMGTLLYGFAPATRDAHPYTPWSGAEAAGWARIRLADGRCWEVHRQLRSGPTGSLVRDGAAEELRNRTLPCAEHVPPAVFRQVYAITLSELAGLDGAGWNRIQERLIVALGAPDLRPARAVAEELEQEAAQLWRPNRRGRQLIREQRSRLRELAAHRREVAGADQDLRGRVRERDRARAELAGARAERESAKLYVERFGALLTVRSALARIHALEQEAGPAEALATLPAQPARRLEELTEQLRAQRSRVDQATHDAETARHNFEALPPVDARLLERVPEVDRVTARVQAAGWTRARSGQLQQETRELEAQLETEARDLFTVPWERLALDRLRAFPAAELRTLARELEEARARLDARREAEREIDRRTIEDSARGSVPRVSPAWALLVLGLGAVLLLLGRVIGGPAADASIGMLIAGALAFGAGSVLLASALRRPRSTAPPLPSETPLLQDAVDEAERALAGLLVGLPMRDGLVQRAPAQIAVGLERLQHTIRQRRDREGELAGLREQETDLGREVSALALECGVHVPEDALAAAHLLASTTAEAKRRHSATERAVEELARLARQRDREMEAFDRLATEESGLTGRLSELANGNPVVGLSVFRTRTEAAAGAARLRRDLEAAHPDLDELRERIRAAEADGEEWIVNDHALTSRRVLIEELDEHIEDLIAHTTALDGEIDALAAGETLDRVDGEIQVLDEEVRRLERERDRRYVLARLIREADRRFREEHQPALVRRAGEYLATITGGRYERVLVADGTSEGSFMLRGAEGMHPVEVALPLSTATREQVYLALRLAAVDHLDQEGERLPLFLDETLVNWDPSRQDRGLALLARLAQDRQLFVFTCHPGVAAALARQGAVVVTLDVP